MTAPTPNEGGSPTANVILSQDTSYVLDRDEASLLVPLIDEAFADGRGYIDAQRQLGSSIKLLRGAPDDEDGSLPEVNVESEPEAEPTGVPDLEASGIGEPIAHELDRALMYEFVVPFDGPVTCELGHYDSDSEFVWPPRIQNVTDAVADLWEFLAANVQAPGAKARFRNHVADPGQPTRSASTVAGINGVAASSCRT